MLARYRFLLPGAADLDEFVASLDELFGREHSLLVKLTVFANRCPITHNFGGFLIDLIHNHFFFLLIISVSPFNHIVVHQI